MRKTNTGQVEKGYIKNQVTYPKKGLLYLGSEMCDQTQDKGDTERPRLKGAASCFTGHGGGAQMIAVPLRVVCPRYGVPLRERKTLCGGMASKIEASGAAPDRAP